MNLEKIIEEVRHIAAATAEFIREQQVKISNDKIETKSTNNFVTYVDKTSEEKIVKSLKLLLPEAGFITEEDANREKSQKYNWVVDPLDGTTNFIHGIPIFSISIGLIDNDVPIAGVIYDVLSRECFYAWQGGGAWLNGKKIETSKAQKVKDSLIATGFPYYDYSYVQKYMGTLLYFMQNSHGLRRIGSAAIDLAYVACGRFEAFYEYSLHAWDVAAGIIIVQEAGGKIGDFSGGNNYLYGAEIIASCSGIYTEMQRAIEEIMKK